MTARKRSLAVMAVTTQVPCNIRTPASRDLDMPRSQHTPPKSSANSNPCLPHFLHATSSPPFVPLGWDDAGRQTQIGLGARMIAGVHVALPAAEEHSSASGRLTDRTDGTDGQRFLHFLFQLTRQFISHLPTSAHICPHLPGDQPGNGNIHMNRSRNVPAQPYLPRSRRPRPHTRTRPHTPLRHIVRA